MKRLLCALAVIVQSCAGQFVPNGAPPVTKWIDPHGTGVFRTQPFRAPDTIHLYLNGFVNKPAMRLYLEDTASPRTLALSVRIEPGKLWRRREWRLPADWRGAQVRLVAEDHSPDAWIALTPPEPGGVPLGFSLVRAFYRCAWIPIVAGLFLLPGFGIALAVARGRQLDAIRIIAIVLAGSAAAGYAAFWAYFADPRLGRIASIVILLVGARVLFGGIRRGPAIPRHVWREVAACFALMTVAAVFYNATGFLFLSDDGALEIAENRFFSGPLPNDDGLQFILADCMYSSYPVKPFLSADWKSSDRPPLATGAALEQYPLWLLDKGFCYQFLCVWLQCIWIAGVWAVLRSAGITARSMVPILALAIFSDFCWLHSFFVWPKLMSAGFALMAIALFPLVRGQGSKWTRFDACLAAACLGAGLMSHTGIAFTLIAVLGMALFRRELPRGRTAIAAVAILLAFLVPWQCYQKFYDPPGDQLLKLHLLGDKYPDKPLGEAARIAFTGYTPQKFLAGKIANFEALAGHPSEIFRSSDTRSFFDSLTRETFFSLLLTIGLLNCGFVARFFVRRNAWTRVADRLLIAAAISIVIWILLMYTPGGAVVHQGSFATVLMLFIALGIYLEQAWPRAIYGLVILQAAVLQLYVFAKPFLEQAPGAVPDVVVDPGMAVVAVLSAGALAVVLVRWRRITEF